MAKRWFLASGQPQLLFTENETNFQTIFNSRNRTPYVKDAFHQFLIHGDKAAVNPAMNGTTMAALYSLTLGPGESAVLKLRLTDTNPVGVIGVDSPVERVSDSPRNEGRCGGSSRHQRFCRWL